MSAGRGGRAAPSRARAGGRALAALALLALLPGCNRRIQLSPFANQRPVVNLVQSPVSSTSRYFYSYELRWNGYDPDGRVDHFEYAVDPPAAAHAETAWVATRENRKTLQFASSDPDSLGTKQAPGGYHVFVIRAVDDRGLDSEPAIRAFTSYTIAPDVRIVNPQPSHLIFPLVPPSIVISWTGHDPDGVHTTRPVKYKYKLFKEGGEGLDLLTLALYPDTLRKIYAPGFAGWDSTVTDTFTQVSNLIPDNRYVFVVVAMDEAGAYSPVFSFDLNMLYFNVSFVGTFGPVITMYNDQFDYTYPTGGYFNDPLRYVNIEIAADTPVTIYWHAEPGEYTYVKQYRWAMDIANLDDETPRSGPGDVRHWSFPAISLTQATVGPFSGVSDSTHLFFIEAEDNNGLKSLGILSIRVVRPTFENSLLFVNDTRFSLDQGDGAGGIRTAIGSWPCEAELDTFLFARGNVPWRGYPPGTLSPPGILRGYPRDTVETYRLPGDVVPLSMLARYRHVAWMTSANPGFGVYLPSLQYMSTSGHTNSLATYVRMGGRAWLSGGGAASATLLPFDVRSNNLNGATVFSPAQNELIPGRFMYDAAKWRSEISALVAVTATRNAALPSGPGIPDYSGLPPLLRYRDSGTDPIPPFRGYDFYETGYAAEYLSQPNVVTEPLAITPDSSIDVPVLDTLYYTSGGSIGLRPVMTLYRGSEGPPFVFSGFPLWYFTRLHAKAVGDWVLHSFWGLDTLSLAPAPRPARLRHGPRS